MLPEHAQRAELFRAKAEAHDLGRRWRAAEAKVERLERDRAYWKRLAVALLRWPLR